MSGDDKGNFNPESPISRQDMSVIIYNAGLRFGLFEEANSYAMFSDDSDISGYAKKAVYCLKNNRIVNGVGEEKFAPLDNADRAAAAKIIYTLMTKYDK